MDGSMFPLKTDQPREVWIFRITLGTTADVN